MKIRTKIVLAFFLLAVLPLTGIVLYSYDSSLRAVRETVAGEARELTAEMDSRMNEVERDLERRVQGLGRLPLRRMLIAPTEAEKDELLGKLLAEMGEAAGLVEAFELIPFPEAAPSPPRALRPPRPPGAPAPVDPADPLPAVAEPSALERIVLRVTEDVRRRHIELENSLEKRELEIIGKIHRDIEVVAALAGVFAVKPEAPAAPEAERETPPELRVEVEVPKRASRLAREKTARARARARAERGHLFAHSFGVPVHERGRLVGQVRARFSPGQLLRGVLEHTRRDQGEIPFARDAQGELYVVDEADREILDDLPLDHPGVSGDWVIATSTDPKTGLEFGIVRPIREPLEAVRRAAARNFTYGLGLIGLALLGILPLSGRMTRDLRTLSDGAEKIAARDLTTRVPVRSRDELGQLARAFNDMAHDLELHRDQEIDQLRLQADYERKTRELEEARQFQLSLLPAELPRHRSFEIAVYMKTATEVGGDYYDFHLTDDGTLTVAVGDATGHGARAGTMVTVVKSLFSAYAPGSGLRRFLLSTNRTVRRMDLGRMSMTLVLAEFRRGSLTVSSAGMPPTLIHRLRSGEVEEVALEGMPLGGLEFPYREQRLDLEPGDTALFMTDGLPELLGADGEVLGYDRARELFAAAAAQPPQQIVDELAAAVSSWTGGEPPNDDVTFVAVKVRGD